MRGHKVRVFGAPCAAGGRAAGIGAAPALLRQAGLIDSLRSQGLDVVDLGDLPPVPWSTDDAHPECRNAEVLAPAIRAVSDRTAQALREAFLLVLGGDCSIAPGTLDGAWKALAEPVGLVYLDADADLNTPETSPSGFVNGMALALALGDGPVPLRAGAPVGADHVSLVGFRALDPGERNRIGELGLALPAKAARKLGMRAAAGLALDGVANGDGPIVVHLDVDVVDPAELPAKSPVTPGEALSLSEASELLGALLASPRVVGLEIVELDADAQAGEACARALVEMLTRAIARRREV